MSRISLIGSLLIFTVACGDHKVSVTDARIKTMDSATVAAMAKTIEAGVTPKLAEGLSLKLWGVDSLVADPVSISIDDQGRIYYTRTIRQKDAEFDIRGHQDWEIRSIALSSIDDKRNFLHTELSPERSVKNKWLRDLNGDSSHDWRDMTIQKEQVWRVEDANKDGLADKSQLVVEDFHDEVTDAAGGVLKYGKDLFVAIGPDLWRLQENEQGLADTKESISSGYGIHIGFSGHGMSGVRMGPEGKIYWQIGDIGFRGKDKNGKEWNYANSGVICRSNPDGSDFEVFAYGNRNTHEFVFDEYGNMISEDNDGDHPGESERIVYVVNGADIGWRANWQYGKYNDPDNNTYKVWMDEKMYVPRWEGQPAYILPTIKNFVNGPTGMLYNPGTALSSAYRNTFFVVEFVGSAAGSGIHTFKLKPKGASFEFADSGKILGNVLPTGIDWGPDGAMYVADWIDGWGTKDYGRIWKLDVANPDMRERRETEKHVRADMSSYKVQELSLLLRYPDMRVRQKAQFELANRDQQGLDIFKTSLADKQNQLARVHAIWGISQFARKDLKHAALLVPYLADSDPEIRAQAARWIGDVRYGDAGKNLLPLLKDPAARVRFYAAEALGRIEYAPAIQPVVDMLAANNDEDNYLRHAGSLALARIGKPEPVIALSSHPSRAVRIAAVIALRRLAHPGIRVFLKDQDPFVVTETARAINDDLSIPGALPDLARSLADHRVQDEAFVRRAINANLREGKPENLDILLAYIAFDGAPAAMRNEAMDALSTWAKPSVLDRVDGRFRGEVTRDPAPVRKASSSLLKQMLAQKDPGLRIHAAKALGKLGITDATDILMASLKMDAAAEVRSEVLKALSKIPASPMDSALGIAIADREKMVRVAGLDLLRSASLSKERMVALLDDVIRNRTPEEKQAAITTLATLPLASTEAVLTRLVDELSAGKLPPEVQFELADAIDSSGSKALRNRYASLAKKASPDSLKAAYAGALQGGDPRKGMMIFWANSSAQCVRCHAVDDYGGNVGPKLNGVASRLKREQLLEALIEPSARIAPGYGLVSLDLKNGQKLNGILQQEKPEGYLVKVGNNPDTLVKKTDVAQRTNSPSSMPPMHLLLNKKEIRDVVAFLASLK